MLPVISGFIFPNGTTLESNGNGHRKTALLFIRENGLGEKFREYEQRTSGGEDEYLIEVLGAVKICHYCGEHYIYVPRVHNYYIDHIMRKYKTAGYHIKILNSGMVLNVKAFSKIKITCDGYNKTVISRKDVNGTTYYIYNPNIDGD